MRMTSLVYGTIAAIVMAVTVSTVSAADQATAQDRKTAPTVVAKAEKAPVAKFATLKDVNAVPMAARELDAVKGLHIHFVTPGGFHLVNSNNVNNYGNGNSLPGSGPGYSGLCGAALKSPALSIPGQNPTTGVGGGC